LLVNKKASVGVEMSSFILCLVTIDDSEKAASIAKNLVEAKLAACVTLINKIRSIYTWKEQLCDETEVLMIIKTKLTLYDELERTVKSLHPYEVPEIISCKIEKGLQDYLKWIDDSTKTLPD
jgi:periplasmic divalent cation tolerance protein